MARNLAHAVALFKAAIAISVERKTIVTQTKRSPFGYLPHSVARDQKLSAEGLVMTAYRATHVGTGLWCHSKQISAATPSAGCPALNAAIAKTKASARVAGIAVSRS